MTPLAGEPLPVEFRHGGEWHPAVLLGWRHAPDGGCSMRLRFVVGGLRRSSWLPLADGERPLAATAHPGAAPPPLRRRAQLCLDPAFRDRSARVILRNPPGCIPSS
jgi:hypothetical protein